MNGSRAAHQALPPASHPRLKSATRSHWSSLLRPITETREGTFGIRLLNLLKLREGPQVPEVVENETRNGNRACTAGAHDVSMCAVPTPSEPWPCCASSPATPSDDMSIRLALKACFCSVFLQGCGASRNLATEANSPLVRLPLGRGCARPGDPICGDGCVTRCALCVPGALWPNAPALVWW